MSTRRHGLLALNISAGAYKDENECKTALETILRQIERKHKNRNIPICGFAVSSCSAKGTVKYTPWGRKHKPNTTIEPYHIHAVFATDAFSSSVKIIREYLKKCYGKGKIRHDKILEHNMFWIDELKTPTDVICWTYYCIGQGLHVRKTTSTCNEEFVKKYCSDLILTAEKANKRVGAIQPLFPQYAHLLPKSIYDNFPSRKMYKIPRDSDGGVDKVLSTLDTTHSYNQPHKTILTPFSPKNKPNQCHFGAASTYQAPFSEDVLNSNVIIRDAIRLSNTTHDIYNHNSS